MSFYDRFDELCRRKGKAKSPVCEELGLNKTSWVKWKKGSQPDTTTIVKMADYFGVSEAWLLERQEEETINIEDSADTLEIREMLRNRPGMRLLFDAVKDAPDSDLYETLALAMRLKEQSKQR